MNIKTSIALTLIFFLVSSVTYSRQNAASDGKNQVQQVINDYYKNFSEKEKFTAIVASVLIPQNRQNNNKKINTVVTGTMGYPPFSQPVTPSSLFEIGSITKSFTALILLQLQIEGKLSLEDHLGKWLPEYHQWKDVTLRQLLNMTSGIPNYSEDKEFDKKLEAHLDAVWTNEELLTYAHPDKPLEHKRKNLYEYCNSNYILAAMVIEKVTQDTFANQLKLRILNAKNGLNNTFYPAGANEKAVQQAILERKVHGYYYDAKTNKSVDTINNDLSWAGAAGAIVADTEDVVHWVQLLYRGLLINARYRERILAELESVVSMKTGRPISTVTEDDPRAFGLGVGYLYDKETRQRFWVYKGSTLGFRVMYLWQPCNDVTTVVALNSKGGEGNPDSKLGDEIMKANINLYKVVMKNYPELRCMV